MWGEITPEALDRGVGGREGSMIHLSKEWAKAGHEVTCFTNAKRGKRYYEDTGFHEYVPMNLTKQLLYNFPWDVAIAWECPSIFNEEGIRENIKLKITELQCADFPDDEQLECANLYSDYVAPLSKWHKEYLISRGLEKTDDEIVVFPNGIDISRFTLTEKPLRKPWRFVYSSSPDRGLWHLLKCWPRIRQLDNEAELVVTYGVNKWVETLKWSHGRQGEMAVEIERLMKQDGVVDFGKVGQKQLAKLQTSSVAWLYPLDAIQATETGCITALENMAAGNPVITTDCDCMEDEFSSVGIIVPLPFEVDKFMESVEFVLTDDNAYKTLQEQGYEFIQKRDWRLIARQWENFFLNHN